MEYEDNWATTPEEQEAIQRDVKRLKAIGEELQEPSWHNPAVSRAVATTVHNELSRLEIVLAQKIFSGQVQEALDLRESAITGMMEWAVQLGQLIERGGGLEVTCDGPLTEMMERDIMHDVYHNWESNDHQHVHGEGEAPHQADLFKPQVNNPMPVETIELPDDTWQDDLAGGEDSDKEPPVA